jgi:hypothetical protein
MDSLQDLDNIRDHEADAVMIDNGWKNPPKVSDLKADYISAKGDHDLHMQEVSNNLDYLNITGIAKRKPQRNASNVQPKTIRKQAEWRYPNLSEPFLNTENIFTVEPATYADVEAAKQNEQLLNYQFNIKLDKVLLMDTCARVLVNEGTAILRVGWDYREGLLDEEKPVYSFNPVNDAAQAQQLTLQYQQIGAMMQQGAEDALKQVDPSLIIGFRMSQQTGQLVQAAQTGTEIVKVKGVTVNQPTVEVCDYRNVMIDPTCKGDLDKAGFVIFQFETSLSDLKKQTGLYKNLDKIEENIKNAILNRASIELSDDEFIEGSNFNYKDKARKKFTAYEYWGFWDYNDTGIAEPFVATWVDNILIRLEENPFPDKKLPFVLIPYLPRIRSVYGEPDGVLLEDNQKIVGAVTRGMIDIMGKSATGQRATRADALDLVNKKKFEQGLDFEFQSTGGDPSTLFHVFQFPEIPQSAPLMLQMQNAEAEALTGVKAFSTGSQGISGASLGESATAARGALDAASKRELTILRRMSEGMKKVARKIIAMNAVFLSEEEVIRVTDSEFVTIKRDALRGEFDLKLKITTAEDDNAKAQELAFMLQTGAANADPEEVRMIRAEIADLRKMPALAKKIRDFKPEPDPLVVKEQELKIKLLEAQIQNELAKAHENAANGDKDLEIVNTEKAKQRKLLAEADAIDLDYVEQESGVHQEREKEKIDLQHRATMQQKEADIRIAQAKTKPQPKKD